jgi:hypothetical protein
MGVLDGRQGIFKEKKSDVRMTIDGVLRALRNGLDTLNR